VAAIGRAVARDVVIAESLKSKAEHIDAGSEDLDEVCRAGEALQERDLRTVHRLQCEASWEERSSRALLVTERSSNVASGFSRILMAVTEPCSYAKTCFQSFFMLTTVQPALFACS